MFSQYFSITIFILKVLKDITLFPLDNIHKYEAHEKEHTLILGSKSRKNIEVIYELIHELDITGILVSASKHQVPGNMILVKPSMEQLVHLGQ